jgi:hypothetical protein
MREERKLVILLVVAFLTAAASAETIPLKSEKVIEGKGNQVFTAKIEDFKEKLVTIFSKYTEHTSIDITPSYEFTLILKGNNEGKLLYLLTALVPFPADFQSINSEKLQNESGFVEITAKGKIEAKNIEDDGLRDAIFKGVKTVLVTAIDSCGDECWPTLLQDRIGELPPVNRR